MKLRYNDPVSFVEVDKLTTEDSREFSKSASTGIGIDAGPFDEILGIGGSYTRSHEPQIAFTVLRGDTYAKQLLSPLAPQAVFALSQSGWSIERLMLCCVSRFGDLENVRAAAGPTPEVLPDNSDFENFAKILREYQTSGGNSEGNLRVQLIEGNDQDVVEQRVVLTWSEPAESGDSNLRNALVEHGFTLDELNSVTIAPNSKAADAPYVRGRSLLGIMSALSQTVNVPAEHCQFVQQSKLPGSDTPSPCGKPINICEAASPWTNGLGNFFAVSYSDSRPQNAVTVRYRDHWFFVDDSCRDAKSTLLLLGHLYALQASVSGAGESESLFLLGTN